MAEQNLDKLREEIDKIDEKILKLYEERMAVCEKIGEYKKANGIPAYDEDREAEKLDKVFAAVTNKKYADGAAQIFLGLMQASTEMQEMMILGEDYYDDYTGEEEIDDFNWDGVPVQIDL